MIKLTYNGELSLVFQCERDESIVTFAQACENIREHFNEELRSHIAEELGEEFTVLLKAGSMSIEEDGEFWAWADEEQEE